MRSTTISQYCSAIHNFAIFFFMSNLRDVLVNAEKLGSNESGLGFDFSQTDWEQVFLPLIVSGGVRAVPLALAFMWETMWLNVTIPRPRTADLAGMAAQIMAIHAHAVINCAMWLLFSLWLKWKVEGDNGIGDKMLFTPFYIQWGLTFAARFGLSWYCADRPAGGHQRDRENMPLTKALNFSVFANLWFFVLAVPVRGKLSGDWDTNWATVMIGPWVALSLINVGILFGVLYVIYEACKPNGEFDRSTALGIIFTVVLFGLLPIPLTYGLAQLVRRLDGHTNIAVAQYMTPILTSIGFYTWCITPSVVQGAIRKRREALDNPGAGVGEGAGNPVNMVQFMQAMQVANNRQPRRRLIDHTEQSHLQRIGSSLFQVLNRKRLSSSQPGARHLSEAVDLTGVVVEASSGAGAESGENLCVVCFDERRGAVLIPCGHAETCMGCARKIAERSATCPICRTTITEVFEVGPEHRGSDGTIVMTSSGGFRIVASSQPSDQDAIV